MDRKNMLTAFNSTKIEFEICNLEKHNETYPEIFKTTQHTAFYCVALAQQNKTLYGKLGDFPNGFSLLGVYVNRCNPEEQKCLDDSIIEEHLSDFVVGITYSSFTVDHYNYSIPNNRKFENNGVFPMSLSLLKCYFYNLAQVIYETDYGLVFEEKQTKVFYEFESQTVDINMPGMTTNAMFASEFTVGYILFKCAENVSFFYRSYGKAQAVIANIGGVINAMLVLSNIVFDFFTRKYILVDLANSFFRISDDDEISGSKIFLKKKTFDNNNNNFKNNNKIRDVYNSFSEPNEVCVKIKEFNRRKAE
jgi:hypothetical protein